MNIPTNRDGDNSPDWTRVSANPVSEEVHDFLAKTLLARRRRSFDLLHMLRDYLEDRSVLDIGVVEHDPSHYESDAWRHRHIREWASSLLGIDILESEVQHLRGRGYNVRTADATSDADLGQRFERVFIGDVLEHGDAVRMLMFARRHLGKGGLILATTPNPFFYKFIVRTIRVGTFVANAEHTAWISPSMAVELGRRAGLELTTYWLIQPHGHSTVTRFVHRLRDLGLRDSELFTYAFLYVFEPAKVR
ncbi:MAG: class I SAM-dependent methyltransferase [Gemmatimonadota bacterium]|nr:class I SAM-dependent methyltransferase [Gemmatimonadota bacterium]